MLQRQYCDKKSFKIFTWPREALQQGGGTKRYQTLPAIGSNKSGKKAPSLTLFNFFKRSFLVHGGQTEANMEIQVVVLEELPGLHDHTRMEPGRTEEELEIR